MRLRGGGRIRALLLRVGVRYYFDVAKFLDDVATIAFRQKVGRIGSNASLRHPFYVHHAEHITIGDFFNAGPGLRIEAWDSYSNVEYQPRIEIGERVCINYNVHIGAIDHIAIGDYVLIGSNVLITDHSHGVTDGSDAAIPFVQRPLVSRGPVIIHSNVWIGEGACILAGVTIGTGAIIGANAVVTRDVASGERIAGVPGRPLLRR